MAEKRNKPMQAPQNGQPSGPRRWASILFYVLAFAILGYWIYGDRGDRSVSKELSYTKLTAYVEADAVDKIVVFSTRQSKRVSSPPNILWSSARKPTASGQTDN